MNYLNSVVSSGNAVAGDTGLQLNNVEILYTKVQRVYIKPEHKEERQTDLRVNVEVHAGISPVCRKSLCLLFSDDCDPCFLYSLFITEDDFKILKSQQGLLVDFDNFATQLICLLEQCQVPPSSSLSKTQKFLLLLTEESGDWFFKVVETNNFKHLCHLSLNIAPANDTDIKTHMAMKIKQLKENMIIKDRDMGGMETRIKDLLRKLEIKAKEYEQLEQKYMTEKTQFQMNLQQQTTMEQERLSQANMEWQHVMEKEKMKLEQKHSEILKDLHTEVAELRAQNVTFKDNRTFLEATNTEQAKQLQNLEQDLTLAQRELNQIRKQNSKLDVDYHDKDKAVNALRTRVAVLEQELKDKTILINKHTEMLKNAKEQKQRLEELLNEKENQLQRKQITLKGVSDELVKANEILSKLQNELASTKSKLKLRTSIALEQERLLDAKQKEVGHLETKMEGYIKDAQETKAEFDNLKEQVKYLQNQLEEKEKVIKNNDNVISWLNRRLTDNQTPLQSSSIPAPIIPPSIQLTLPRTNKYLPNRHDSPMPNLMQKQPSPMSAISMKNPQNININQTNRNSALSMGINDGIASLSNFNKNGPISNTSTPMDRMNGLNSKLPSSNVVGAPINIDNNDQPVSTQDTKTKYMGSAMQGGLRRVTLDKPALPSAYFSKVRH